MKLSKIEVETKSGKEFFNYCNDDLDFQLLDFWKWNQSNLLENRTRGILAEFIVMKALNILSKNRIEWDFFDLRTNSGKAIEVKSAAYIQSWEQRKLSTIQFGIHKTKSDASNPLYDGKEQRWADYYIFCLLVEKNQNKINPMDLTQWKFYVLETKVLDEKVGNQKTIGLKSILKLEPTVCNYYELKKVFE
ncbi:MAG: hypothetical protein AB8G11_17150 [Saprospiraceae bacterium]